MINSRDITTFFNHKRNLTEERIWRVLELSSFPQSILGYLPEVPWSPELLASM